MPAPLREQFREDRQESGSSGVPASGRGPGRTSRVRACPHRDHELDPERLRTSRLSPASLPCRNQASSCGRRHPGGSPSCLAVRVRFGTLRVVPDPGRCRSSPGTADVRQASRARSRAPCRARNTGTKCLCTVRLTARLGGRETRERLSNQVIRRTWRFAMLGDRLMVGQCPLEALV